MSGYSVVPKGEKTVNIVGNNMLCSLYVVSVSLSPSTWPPCWFYYINQIVTYITCARTLALICDRCRCRNLTNIKRLIDFVYCCVQTRESRQPNKRDTKILGITQGKF